MITYTTKNTKSKKDNKKPKILLSNKKLKSLKTKIQKS